MNKALQGIAQDISHNLTLEMIAPMMMEEPPKANMVDLLVHSLAREVVRGLREGGIGTDPPTEDFEVRLQKIEYKLEKLTTGAATEIGKEDMDEDEASSAGSSFPNLKYAKPKYQNIESVLKYTEGDEDKGGVKLVIMNFND